MDPLYHLLWQVIQQPFETRIVHKKGSLKTESRVKEDRFLKDRTVIHEVDALINAESTPSKILRVIGTSLFPSFLSMNYKKEINYVTSKRAIRDY